MVKKIQKLMPTEANVSCRFKNSTAGGEGRLPLLLPYRHGRAKEGPQAAFYLERIDGNSQVLGCHGLPLQEQGEQAMLPQRCSLELRSNSFKLQLQVLVTEVSGMTALQATSPFQSSSPRKIIATKEGVADS
jgi:hypothetical protein